MWRLSAYYGQAGGHIARAEADRRAVEALDLVGLPTETGATTQGLGAAALKKLELARALATEPRLLLADESLGGLDAAEMDRAAEMLEEIRRRLGITIIWVEHIMGVLMRDRRPGRRARPRRKDFRGRAGGGSARRAGHRGLSRPRPWP